MKAAEMLVEMLLNEGGYAIVYGPNVPETGYWVAGNDWQDMVGKAVKGLKLQVAQGAVPGAVVNTLMAQGYTLVTRIRSGSTEHIAVFGHHSPKLNDIAINMLGVTPSSQVLYYHHDVSRPQQIDAQSAFGLGLAPSDKETWNKTQQDTQASASNLDAEHAKAWQTHKQAQRLK